jgi:hypothetical protein
MTTPAGLVQSGATVTALLVAVTVPLGSTITPLKHAAATSPVELSTAIDAATDERKVHVLKAVRGVASISATTAGRGAGTRRVASRKSTAATRAARAGDLLDDDAISLSYSPTQPADSRQAQGVLANSV